jgi:hypothetical protein
MEHLEETGTGEVNSIVGLTLIQRATRLIEGSKSNEESPESGP